MRAPPLVRAQLGESLKAVAGKDFPEHWPGLLPAILQNLSSQVRPCWLMHCHSAYDNGHPCILSPRTMPSRCSYAAAFMRCPPPKDSGG